MVRGQLEIPLEKSGARGFQKNGARGLQTKWGQRFAEKMGPGCQPILLSRRYLNYFVNCESTETPIDCGFWGHIMKGIVFTTLHLEQK